MEYHGGEVFFDRPDAMLARIMLLLADVERMQSIGRAALDVLFAQPGVDPDRIAALGYSAGGQIVLELARASVPFKAIAVVHSAFPEAKGEDWAGVSGKVLLCTGSEDPICTPNQILTFGRALQEAGVGWYSEIYGGAEHAFWQDRENRMVRSLKGGTHTMTTVPGVSYDPKATMHAWKAVLDLFGEILQ
jgi:dienelactone hydrolase